MSDTDQQRYQVRMTTGDLFVWVGTRKHLYDVAMAGQAVRYLVCEGGTLVNLDHVAFLRPL